MLISGIQQFTLIDYPNKTSCIIFTPGCNFRCGYCHNSEFVLPEKIKEMRPSFISEEAVINFIRSRVGLLDGVVISGGEPTLQPDLLIFMETVKRLGFLVKIDTNGNRPEILQEALDRGLLDYIAMDIKTSLSEYPKLVGGLVDVDKIKQSIDLIKSSEVDYEFRSTLLKETHPNNVLEDMIELIKGSKKFYLQTFRPSDTLDPEYANYNPYTKTEMEEIEQKFKNYVQNIKIR